MKLYLSSYKLWNNPNNFFNLFNKWKRVWYIWNALDFTYANPEKVMKHKNMDIAILREWWLDVTDINLKDFFRNKKDLYKLINVIDWLWVSWGNVFVLRQAMKLSWLDIIINNISKRTSFIYGWYSAWCCVLWPTLSCYWVIDKINDFPYDENSEVIINWLNIIDYNIIPHYYINNPNIQKVKDEVNFCIENTLPYKMISDWEIIMI